MESIFETEMDQNESVESEEESSTEEIEIAKRASMELPKADVSQLRELSGTVKELSKKVDSDVSRRSAEDSLEGSRHTTQANRDFYKSSPDLDRIVQIADAEQSRIPEQKQKGRLVTRNKFWAWVLPGVLTVGLLSVSILNLVNALNKPDKTDPLLRDLKPAEIALIKAAVDRWRTQPDATFWATLADYVKDWTPSLQAQLLFMTYTKELVGTKQNWPADSTAWLAQRVDELVAACGGTKTMDALYRKVATINYAPNGTSIALPRYLAAELSSLALAQVIALVRTRPA